MTKPMRASPRHDDQDAPISARAPARLSDLLDHRVRQDGASPAIRDQESREAWSGRFPIAWTWTELGQRVGTLAGCLSRLGLEPGDTVGIHLPGGSDAIVALLAAERAGLTACLVPAATGEDAFAALAGETDMRAIVTQGRLGDHRLGQAACAVAFRSFRVRHVLAFGPDIPDGAADLDRVMDDAEPMGAALPPGRLITVAERPDGGSVPVSRSWHSLVAAAELVLPETRPAAHHAILAFAAPDDLASLATGLVSALLTGCELHQHGLFSAREWETARLGRRTHLQLPGALAEALLPRLAKRPASIVSLGPFTDRNGSTPVITVESLSERALVVGREGAPSLALSRRVTGSANPILAEVPSPARSERQASFRSPSDHA